MSRRGEHGFDGNNDRRTCRGGAANENKTRRAPLCLLLPGPDIGPVEVPPRSGYALSRLAQALPSRPPSL